jgi:hypothetical protein
MILTLSLTIIFLLPNLLSNTKFLNALFSNQTHNHTQLLFSIPTHILFNNTSSSTKITETNSPNNIKQSITKLPTPKVSLSLLLVYPPRELTAIILQFTQFQTMFPAQNCKICREYTGKFYIYIPTSAYIQNTHNPTKSTIAPQELIHFLSLSTTTQKQQVFSLSFAPNGSYKKCPFKKHQKTKNKMVVLQTTHLQQSFHLSFYSFTEYNNHSCFLLNMNGYYDTPPGFHAARHSATPTPRNASSLPLKLQDLSNLDASLVLRANYKIRTHLLRVSNCPMKSKDIHRLWIYINTDLGYKVGSLPFQPDDSLSDNAYEWAHPDSTTKRPLLISDAVHENPMLFHSTVLTISGRTHPGWERDPSVSASFPMYTEHRINLSAFVTNPKSKRLEPQTRLIQIQPTLISPGSEQFWTPIFILSGLGNSYSQSKCCITGAVLSHLYACISLADPDFGERFTRSVQLDWSFFQFNSVEGNQRTQPVAVLKVCKNDPDDQTAAATEFARKIGNLILGHIFASNPAASTVFAFCGFNIRVHRVDRSGSLQPLGDILRRELTLMAPSDTLFKITLQNLSPYPSLPLILYRLKETGISDIQNIAYVQAESHRGPRPNRLDWMHPFQVAIFLQSAGSAHALLHPHNQSHISQCLSPLLEDSMVPLILIPPSNLPPVSAADHLPPLRFPTSSVTQHSLQRLYQALPIQSVQQHYLHPAPAPIPQPTAVSPASASAPSRHQSPKRSRIPGLAEEESSSPKPLVPTDDDERLFSEISERLEYLYQRLPSDTYSFVSTMLDRLRDQLSQDGLLEEEATQPFSSSASSFHHGSSLPGQSSLSSQSSDLLLGISPTQSATPPR